MIEKACERREARRAGKSTHASAVKAGRASVGARPSRYAGRHDHASKGGARRVNERGEGRPPLERERGSKAEPGSRERGCGQSWRVRQE